MEPLYYFKLNRDTGEITKRVITDYTKKPVRFASSRSTEYVYKWRDKSQMKQCHQDDIDKYKNEHLYSFCENKERAKDAILDALNSKAEILHKDYERISQLIRLIEENN